jgi:hypothetical protein
MHSLFSTVVYWVSLYLSVPIAEGLAGYHLIAIPMRYLCTLMLVCLCCIGQAQEAKSHFSSWNDFVATTARTFRTGTNRIVISEDLRITDKYTPRSFEADASVNGYYIIVLYNSRFCTSPPTEYFNYGEGTGGDYAFHGDHDGEYCYHLLKVKTYPGKRGTVYVKTTPGNCESWSVKLFVIEF